MYPEDRVLVAYVPRPADFRRLEQEGWYRIPFEHAPKGVHAEYYAFYLGGRFADRKWSISHYARNLGHELVERRELLPEATDEAKADNLYYKIQLGRLVELERPIVSLRWRRITFLHTTWDRFQDALEINDLFIDGGPYVDRLFATLKDRGLRPERNYRIKDATPSYRVPIAVLCRQGLIEVAEAGVPQSAGEVTTLAASIEQRAAALGGVD